ncbi:MAG TPA: hypothetical protein VN903_36395, partial [Polyangia bacterium]|nr:hypothetical protein [Polyangia bacterium]
KLFDGDSFASGAQLAAGQPLPFIQQVLAQLNDPATGQATRDSWFDNLPQDEAGSALEYSATVTDHATQTTRNAYNFALARVHIQGANGAANVRAFFRVFRYTATNLAFDDSDTGTYRVFPGAGGVDVPLLGFDSTNAVASIPFFATDRVSSSQSMKTQPADSPNVFTFPTGSTAEQWRYFGVWLDINQDTPNSRLPATRIAAHPDGGFTTAEVEPIRSILIDAHCCLVAEIRYDGDPTVPGASPAVSDNLAQRNLAIVQTDNPGAAITHTVEHSFLSDLGGRSAGHRTFGPSVLMTAAARERMAQNLAGVRAFNQPSPDMREVARRGKRTDESVFERFLVEARAEMAKRVPLVFDAVDWQSTSAVTDELMFRWNGLPRSSRVELRLPGVNAEQVTNLRALRHAPPDVKIVDSHTLAISPSDVTYIPLPPTTRLVAGVATIVLPEGVRKGQRWKIDVTQLRGAARQITGGFQIDVQVRTADAIVDDEQRLLNVLFTRLARTTRDDLWRPILERRVSITRARLIALAKRAGVAWSDPSTWTDGDGRQHPVAGPRIRVVLERIELEEPHPCRSRGRVVVRARARTADNGGVEQRHHVGPLTFAASHGRVAIERTIFEGFADTNLAIDLNVVDVPEVVHVRPLDDDVSWTFHDPRSPRYRRIFSGAASRWLGDYTPTDEAIDPEDLGSWRVWYRIERA